MKKLYGTFLLGGILLSAPAFTQCIPCGTGTDGAFTASSSTTLPGGTYNYTTFTINAGATVTVTGTQPLVIYCTGNVVIDGTLDASGGNGGNGLTYTSAGTAGTGVAGGQNGGAGTFSPSTGPLAGVAGAGSGAGGAGGAWSGGGGAGYSTTGQSASATDGLGGPAYGNAQLSAIDGGSGGGGGSGGYNCGAGGGGGGGGYVRISSCGTVTIGAGGMILANGGNGGTDDNGSCGGGGGGSGGSIWLASSSTFTNNGSVSATGGLGGSSAIAGPPYYGTGGNGADGRIRFDYAATAGTGTVTPAAYFGGITISISSTDVTCNGACDGTATATVSGGTPGYTYLWMPGGQTTSTLSGLCAGTYSLVVTDANGCTATATVTITQPTAVTAVDTFANVTCNGACDGWISIIASGGFAPYTFAWSNGATTPTITPLCAGCYTVVITDAGGCTITEVVCITEPAALAITTTHTDETSAPANDGTAAVSVTGGTPAYSYLWSPGGDTTAAVTGLDAGLYIVTVTDSAGCSDTAHITIGTMTGLNDMSTSLDVSLFPNPTSGLANLVIAAPAGETVTVEISDVTGRLIDVKKYTGSVNEVIELTRLQNGVYMFRVTAGDSVVTKKITLNR